jgi:hypothetical protein
MSFPVFASGDVLNASDMNAVGLWKVTTATASSQATLSIDNCFSSNYDNYRIVFSMTAVSANVNFYWRLRVGGVDSTASYYWSANNVNNGGTSTTNAGNNVSLVNPSFLSSSTPRGMTTIDLTLPNESVATVFNFIDNYNDTVAQQVRQGGGIHLVNTAYDGITIGVAGGATFSGIARVYGYRD